MNQRGLTWAALAMSFVAMIAALWVLLSEGPRRGGESEAVVASGRAKSGGGAALRAVAPRRSDDAGDRVSGTVIELGTGPLEHGVLTFECAATGRPILGANVRLGANGSFETVGCGGTVCAQLRHPSFVQAEAWVLEPGRPAELFAREMARLEGVVSHGTQPVAGARITVVPAEEDPMALPPLVSRHAQSDDEGAFSLTRVEVPPCDPCAEARGICELGEGRRDVLYRGPLEVLVMAPGYRAFSTTLPGMPEAPIEVALEVDDSPVIGTLADPDGALFERAEIIARSELRPHESHHAFVVAGRFELHGMGAGPYTLRVLQDGSELLDVPGVEAGARLELEAEVPAAGGTVVVEVRDTKGEARTDARVGGGPFGRGAKVDAAGRVEARQVMPGRHRLRVWADGVKPRARTVEVGLGEDVRVALEL